MHIMDNIELTDVERRLVNGMRMGKLYNSDPAVYPDALHFHDIEGFPRGVKSSVIDKLVRAGYLDSYGDAGWMKIKDADNDPPEDVKRGVLEVMQEQFNYPEFQYYWRAGDKFHCVLMDDDCRLLFVTANRSTCGLKVVLDNIALDHAPHGNDPFANLTD